MTTTGNVNFVRPSGNTRTVGDYSRFAPVTRTDIEDLLLPLGFAQIRVIGTSELVYARRHGFLSLRVLSGVNADGTPRPRGKDAIRTQLWKKDRAGIPFRVRGAKRTMRVPTWRTNLIKKIDFLTTWAKENQQATTQPTKPATQPTQPVVQATDAKPRCPKCGGAMTEPKLGRKGMFHGCIAYPKCRGAVDVAAK